MKKMEGSLIVFQDGEKVDYYKKFEKILIDFVNVAFHRELVKIETKLKDKK